MRHHDDASYMYTVVVASCVCHTYETHSVHNVYIICIHDLILRTVSQAVRTIWPYYYDVAL